MYCFGNGFELLSASLVVSEFFFLVVFRVFLNWSIVCNWSYIGETRAYIYRRAFETRKKNM
jgi:hypothetical protein